MDNQQNSPPGGQREHGHYGPGPRDEGSAMPLIAGLGAVAVLVLCALGAVVVGWKPPPPAPKEDEQESRYAKKEKKRRSAYSSPFVFRPSTGKLKTESDWHAKIGDLQSKGDAASIWKAALLYQNRRCPFRDEMTAINLLQQSANMDFGPAWYDLGNMYEKGTNGVTKSLGLALENYKKAKECNLSNAEKAIERVEKKMREGDF